MAELLAGLKAKRDELAAEMERLRGDIAAIDRTLSLITGRPAGSRKRAPGVSTGLFDRNELRSLVLKEVRAGDDVTAPGLVDAVVRAKNLDLEVPGLAKTLYHRVHSHISTLTRGGVLVRSGTDSSGHLTYRLVR
jgi:hypothetical protein